MRIRRIQSKGLVVSRLPASQLRLLQQIPVHADPAGSPAAEDRLYQSPVRTPLDDTDDALVNDWNDHVVPDLRTDFSKQLECVAADLRRVRRESRRRPSKGSKVQETQDDASTDDDAPDAPAEGVVRTTTSEDEATNDDLETTDEPPVGGDSYELVIPPDHIEAWYGALNQARLVMQARYNLPEIESLAAVVALLASENLKPYLTSRFYTEIQAALLELGMDSD